jgi:type II secretion system protein C
MRLPLLREAAGPHRQGANRPWVWLIAGAIVAGVLSTIATNPPTSSSRDETAVRLPPDWTPALRRAQRSYGNAPTVSPASAVAVTASGAVLLSGTLIGRNPYEGTAHIGVSNAAPLTYVAGAVLANGARVTEIYRDRIVLTRDGESVDLYLAGGDFPLAATSALHPILEPRSADTPAQALADSPALTDYLRPTPVYDGNRLDGYRVYPGKREEIFAQLGLEPGDVIRALDFTPFSSPEDAIERLDALMYGIAVVATVERSGRTEYLSLDGALLHSARFQEETR